MLTQYVLTNAKPREKDYKLSDGDGLYLLVKANGSKLWRTRPVKAALLAAIGLTLSQDGQTGSDRCHACT